MSTVTLKDVTKVWPDGTVAVDRVSLDVDDGEFMVLLGPSGCGKSTILRMIAGLEDPTSGDDPAQRRAGPRPRPARPQHRHGVPGLRALPAHDRRREHRLPAQALRRRARPRAASGSATWPARSASATCWAASPSQLSGGQRQRVAMGRAIVRRPGLFLMDEPLSNLDSGLRAELRAEITGLIRELGVTTIYVTHDQAEALTMADRVAILRRACCRTSAPPPRCTAARPPSTSPPSSAPPDEPARGVGLRAPRPLRRPATSASRRSTCRGTTSGRGRSRTTTASASWSACGPRRSPRSPRTRPGDVLHGRIRYLEHHGHESLAFLDIGATAIVVDEMGGAGARGPGRRRPARCAGSAARCSG